SVNSPFVPRAWPGGKRQGDKVREDPRGASRGPTPLIWSGLPCCGRVSGPDHSARPEVSCKRRPGDLRSSPVVGSGDPTTTGVTVSPCPCISLGGCGLLTAALRRLCLDRLGGLAVDAGRRADAADQAAFLQNLPRDFLDEGWVIPEVLLGVFAALA